MLYLPSSVELPDAKTCLTKSSNTLYVPIILEVSRHFPGIPSSDSDLAARAEQVAASAPPSGSAIPGPIEGAIIGLFCTNAFEIRQALWLRS
ncbi:hypothetical protein EVAR_88703_1 [Eumeta japonica]|uniref:Uncharacterized protein n=1 Tax=Eumeta variegata TaxID=151549 RepID=A0A4C1Y157_EUMVA|nr:hypothetical protein EVAR_88703_1 [Eumeta japonica]